MPRDEGRLCYHCMQGIIEGGRCEYCGTRPSQAVHTPGALELPPGSTLDEGNVLVGEKLGSGGFGVTYIARDRRHGRVALKEFVPRYMLNGRREDGSLIVQPDKQAIFEQSMRSFLREARLLSQIRHPNIVRVLFALTQNDTAYYGMRLLNGEDLRHYVRRMNPLPVREAWTLLLPVVDALIYLHSMRTLHRDLSPDNIFLQREEGGDFGLSPCLIDFGASFTAMRDFTQTMPGVMKNGYSPLEQNWDKEYQGPFTDVYAFCATFYFAVTGRVPVAAGERMQDGRDVLQPISAFCADVPAGVDKVLAHGMALRPQERIQDMISLRKEMNEALAVPPPRPLSILDRLRRK